MRIEIPIFDGFDELDVIGPYEVLCIASRAAAPFEVELVGVDGPAQVRSQNNLQLTVTAGLGRPDALVVPGGGWLNRAPAGAWAEARRGALPAKIAELATTVAWTASVCSGGMLLAESGILRGRTATTNRNALSELAAMGVTTVDNRVVDDGDIVTAGGLTSGLDLALWLVSREAGEDVAARVAATIEYEPRGDIWRRPVVV